jgi:pimeloyl-ACP methyl ester carboxylesterase
MMRLLCLGTVLLLVSPLSADGPRDNDPTTVRRVPRLGVEVPEEEASKLNEGLAKLAGMIQRVQQQGDQQAMSLLPDVMIYHRAVKDNLEHQEFFAPGDIQKAHRVLATGIERARQLIGGHAPWTSQTGLVVRGFISRLDQTVQPYGLVVPPTYRADGESRARVDIWFHGRGETLSETSFIDQRGRQAGQYTPAGTIVLHPYGRYSNAFKFAGEVDVLEALEHVKQHYRVDEQRISVRGFSMGGAACWQFAVHYADRWFAANPGAGFSETPEFLRFFQKETLSPTPAERKLWHLYDCTDYAINLFHCPTVAYSGEIDIQKQAADIMAEALKKEGIELVHVIGPETGHKIHPDAKLEVERRFDQLARSGNDNAGHSAEVHLVTYTLKYNRMYWLTIDRMGEHWQRARVDAAVGSSNELEVATENVTQMTFSLPAGQRMLKVSSPVQLQIGKDRIQAPAPGSDRSWRFTVHLADGHWQAGPLPGEGLVKRSGLQGPIDDALMDSFIFVTPSGRDSSELVNKWVDAELERAIVHWRRHFRGHPRIKKDSEITSEDIASANLVLWGTPGMNSLLGKVVANLPIGWDDKQIRVGADLYPADSHALVGVYPNPLNPDRYVVFNSSFTFRDYAYLNNARQVPMLPDWAVIDLATPPGSQYPGKVVVADFFDENWQLKEK